jgi:protein-disulfide isomerase
MRTGIRILIVTLAASTACVSSGRYRTLEKRVAELETRETERQLEVNGTLLRIEAQLAALAAGFGQLADTDLSALERKLDDLDRRMGATGATGARPTPPRRPGPDPSAVYAVNVAGAPSRGPADALVTIVRAGEYACPFCEKTRDTMDQLLADYGNKVREVHKDFVVHPQTATAAAHAACAAHRQGRYWEMDALLWEKAFKARMFDPSHLEQLAVEAGLDLDLYRADVAGPCPAALSADMAELSAIGVGATPAFFINGRFLSGAQPVANFKTLIDEELELARSRVKKGTKKKRYYDEWVMKKGLTRLAAPTP